jgi:formylglycine-generating enzyme required for sulfatase activity
MRIVLPVVCSFFCIIPAALRAPYAHAAAPQTPRTVALSRQAKSTPPPAAGVLKSYAETMPGSLVKVEMIALPAGNMTTGGKSAPVKSFWIANTETTWEAYDAFLASGAPSKAYDQTEFPPDAIARPSKSYILPDLGWGHHGYPAINVSSLSVTMFCRWLSAQTGKKYRLPTDTEWEYACRAGSTATKPLTPALADKVAWYAGNSDRKTHPVAKKLPNAWKLYDMVGNTGEWATDAEGKFVLCGGIFKDNPDRLVPTMRRRFTPAWQATDPQLPKSRWWLADGSFCGFRIVCEP